MESATRRLRRISDIDIVIGVHTDHHVFSQTVEYALRATLYIARQSPRPVRLMEVAEKVDAPSRYLAKTLGRLARAGILESTRGPAGGFRLAKRQERLTLARVVAAFNGTHKPRCLLGTGFCGRNPNCTVHDRWAPISHSMSEFLTRTTVADLLSSSTSQ